MIQKFCILMLSLSVANLACKTRRSEEAYELTATSDSCLPRPSTGGARPANGPRFGEGVPSAQAIRNIGVSENEIKAVHEYTSSTNSAAFIREILQGMKEEDLVLYRRLFGKDYVQIANDFRSAVTKISSNFPFRGTVWRGIVVYQDDVDKLRKFLAEKKPIGLAFDQSQAYMSTTRSKEFAMSWADEMLEKEKGKIGERVRNKKLIYEIKQCAGAAIETIEPVARGRAQMEIIVPPATFVITDIKEYGSSTVGVFMKELGCKSAGLTDLTDQTWTENNGLQLTDSNEDAIQQDPILKYFDFTVSAPEDDAGSSLTTIPLDANPSTHSGLNLTDTTTTGFALTGSGICPDPKVKEQVKKDFNRVDEAAKKVKAAQAAYNNAPNAEAQNAARAGLKAAQTEATNAAKSLAPYMKSVKVVRVASGALKLVPVLGYLAEGAALGMGIAEAVQIKQQGGSDSAAAAAVLSGFGIAGAIPAILACENCTPDEKAAAFFSGFFGIDFSSLVICPGKRCPQDQDLAGFDGDWSMHRIKRSCPRGVPVVGTSHDDVQINVICSGLRPLPVSNYRYVDNNKWENRWSYDLQCGPNEYVAGLSFLTSRGAPTYGIKSILCATRAGTLSNTCKEVAAESCPGHQFLRGVYLDRAHRSKGNMGTLCSKAVGQGRDDDQFEYCDHVKSVLCCNIIP